MEDYATFVQHHLSSLRNREGEDNKPSRSSSLICFYGRPILPPLLSEEQREEMQRHRDEAQNAAVHRKFRNDSRMAFVQSILHSVQLRKTPTLEELLQESEVSSEHHHIGTGSATHCNFFRGRKDDLLLPPSLNREAEDGVPHPPFTSTAYSACLATNMTPHLEECLTDPHLSQHESLPSLFNGVSHQSSGYVTYEIVANTTCATGGIDTGMESLDSVPSEGAHSLGAFFLHNTSNTIIKMPDIISYPPIDGEELERSGLESSFCNGFVVTEDICRSAIQADSVKSNSLQEEKSESSSEDGADLSVTTILDPVKDKKSDSEEGQVSLSENREFSDELQTISVQHCPTAELQIQQDPTEKEIADNHEDEEESLEEPYPLSLQALLKKSQEYRRRQRMLRNQAKNSKLQEGTQEQPRVRVEEPSLSDKENDEFPHKGNSSVERKKTKDTSGTFVQMSPKNSWDNQRAMESELYNGKTNSKNESINSSDDEKTRGRSGDDEAVTLRNNKMNMSRELMAEPKRISTFAQDQSLSTETLFVQDTFFCKTSPTDTRKGKKYQTIPTPNFCKSPDRCKSKSSMHGEDDVKGTGTPKVSISASLINNRKVNQGSQNSLGAVSPKVMSADEDDVRGIPVRSSQQIDQLESNLCGLKILISDLESTLTGNFKNQSQTEARLTQSDDEENRDVDLDPKESQRRPSSDNFKIMSEDSESALGLNDTDNIPIAEESIEEVNYSELRLLKTLVTEKENKIFCKDGLFKNSRHHGGFKKQQSTAKCLLSAAQRQKIPDIFRNVASEAAAPCNTSVLSDASNHPGEKRNKTAEGCLNTTRSPSLNQSYDVDAPSGLWLLEGLGPDLGPRGHLLQEKDLTPESEGEGQGGVSRVKRRLLMHTTGEIPQRGTDSFKGADTLVRPNSSPPQAAVRWNEGHCSLKERQEQLQQAHTAQVRALQEEHRRQQEDLLQTYLLERASGDLGRGQTTDICSLQETFRLSSALAVRFRLLQSVSFPCSVSGSRLGDTLTFTSLSQPSATLSERCRPLLLAAVKGFLTRRLLRTERVAQLARTVRDTRQLLQALQQQSTGTEKFSGRQDLLLQERVALQLRAARYEVNDIFFSLSAGERIQLISWDRELVRERELRRQSGHTGHPRGKSSLSAATQKSLERKKRMLVQKKAAGKLMGAVTRSGHSAGSSAEQPAETKRGQFRANPQRVPKSTYFSRPR